MMSSHDCIRHCFEWLLETSRFATLQARMAYFAFFAVTLLLALLGGLFSRVAAEKYWM